jgi:hypothetical protein
MSATTEHGLADRIVATIGVIGTIALAYVYVLMPMLVVPSPFVYGFVAAWLVMVVASLAWWRRHPWRTFAIPFVGLVAGLAAIQLGTSLLGWAP